MTKFIIFDFDGTIVETWNLTIKIANRLSEEFGYKKINQKNAQKLRNYKTQEILRTVGLPLLKLPFWVKRVRKEANKEIEFAKPVSGIKTALSELKKNKYNLAIITSNTKENVNNFLRKNNLDFFDFIYSGSSVFGKSKIINKLLKEKNLSLDQTIFVGDETRDIEAARKSKVKIIAVSWGFNSKEILKKQKPDFLINKPKELFAILKKF